MNIFKIFDKVFRPNSLWDKIDIKELHNLWLNPIDYKAPSFPIIHDNYFDNPFDDLPRFYLIKDDIQDVFGDPDYHGYKWEESENFIDSDGYVYIGNYKDMNHPFGWVYPIDTGKRVTLNELKELVINGRRFIGMKDHIKSIEEFRTIKELIENLK